MKRLFLEKSIEIHASASTVWQVLTDPHLTKEWIREQWPNLVIFELEERDGHTELVASVGNSSDALKRIVSSPGAVENWGESLPKIKELAER
jgi:hypothetical protein